MYFLLSRDLQLEEMNICRFLKTKSILVMAYMYKMSDTNKKGTLKYSFQIPLII